MVYFDYLKLQVKSAFQYRASMFFFFIGGALSACGYFFSMMFLFDRFGGLLGWRFEEVALCFGVSSTAFFVTCTFSRGFDVFQRFVRDGSFDRMLTRPRGMTLQVFSVEVNFSQLGRIAQGIVVTCYAASRFEGWNALKIVGVVLMILSGFTIFTGVYMLGATVCFWTVKGLEFVNIFTDGGREIASYPIPIYAKSMVRFFTFALPYACFNYLPLQYISGRMDNPWYLAYPVAGMLFVLPCLGIWRLGMRRYVSTGS